MIIVRQLTAADASACDAIVAGLPYFFSNPVGVMNASRDVRTHTGWASEDEGVVTGFLTLEWSTTEAAEISWLAVHRDYRHGGRGRALVDEAVSYVRTNGGRMLFLCTSPASDPPDVLDGYEGTRRFYSMLGFVRLWVVRPAGWNEEALVMVRSLEP